MLIRYLLILHTHANLNIYVGWVPPVTSWHIKADLHNPSRVIRRGGCLRGACRRSIVLQNVLSTRLGSNAPRLHPGPACPCFRIHVVLDLVHLPPAWTSQLEVQSLLASLLHEPFM